VFRGVGDCECGPTLRLRSSRERPQRRLLALDAACVILPIPHCERIKSLGFDRTFRGVEPLNRAPRAIPVRVRAAELLSEGLQRVLSGYEARDGQLEMVRAIERALAREGHMLLEAGTGTGKTLAYLLPALLSGRKVVVSTATHALQEQILTKDVPIVRAILEPLGVPCQVRSMKGLGNYLCRRRLAEARSVELPVPGRVRALRVIGTFADTHATGDRSDIAGLSDADPTWAEVLSGSDTRVGTGCAFHETCFVTAMRREAESADLIVVNHHLYFADLVLRTGPRGEFASVLPPHDAVIFDEAHQLEHVATEFFGLRFSKRGLDKLAADVERALECETPVLSERAPERALLRSLRAATESLFKQLHAGVRNEGERQGFVPSALPVEAVAAASRLDTVLKALTALGLEREGESYRELSRRARELWSTFARLRSAEEQGAESVWIEGKAGEVTLGLSPVELGGELRRVLFDRVPSVVLTSATLSVPRSTDEGLSAGFHYVRARLGVPEDATEYLVASPFSFREQALLYTPKDLPPPSDASYTLKMADRAKQLVAITGGGAFVLTTSIRAMKSVAVRLRELGTESLLVQGEMPKSELLETFRRKGDAVLVATMSFWEGVDVPGQALRLVIMDKIPFAVPTDPLVQARARRMQEQGGNPFAELFLPGAAITLRQGFGRLLRTQKDRGIVAILDRRMMSMGYGRMLLSALPQTQRAVRLEEVEQFWQRAGFR
jgi:ATP-dependent DNA helicase DinG